MFYYVTTNGNQLSQMIETELEAANQDYIRITTILANQIKQEGLRAFTYRDGLQLKPQAILALDKTTILADGQDTAILTITTDAGPATIDVFYNGVLSTADLVNGVVTIPIAADAAQTIEITLDPLVYRFMPITLEAI